MKILFTITAALLLCILFAASAQVVVTPETHLFSPVQVKYGSDFQEFTVENNTENVITITPEDVTLVGKNATQTTLSVLTYNIESDHGNWPGRLEYILKELRHHKVDVIGLQEVIQRATLPNQAMQLADSLGFYYYFDSVDGEENAQRYGNAIVSRYPIVETHFRRLAPLNNYRTALLARIDVNGHLVDVYNTHLHHKGLDGHIRDEQIKDLLEFIAQTRTSPIAFLTGDFNANPNWDEMQQIYSSLTDVYPVFHPDHLAPQHATLNERRGHQMRRIDYVFFSTLHLHDLQPISAKVILDVDHNDDQLEADHFGVLGSFLLRADDAHFLADLPSGGISVLPGESGIIQVYFKPVTTGMKESLLTIKGQQVMLAGEAFDAGVYSLPWHESFDNILPPDLPLGWSTDSQWWKTQDIPDPEDLSARLVFEASEAPAGVWSVISPPVYTAGFDSLVLSLNMYAHLSGLPGNSAMRLFVLINNESHLLAQWSDINSIPGAISTYTINASDHGTGTPQAIFLKLEFTKNGNDLEYWVFNEINLTPLQALAVMPASHQFPQQQTGTSSLPRVFTLKNIGGGVLELHPDDISITGPDSDDFSLHNITEAVFLEEETTAEVQVHFSPAQTGEREAHLTIVGNSIPLSGSGFDATIVQLPWHEDFSEVVQGGIPQGWHANALNWDAWNISRAGEQAPEMVFWWEPSQTGRFYLTTPEIVTQGYDTLVFSMNYRINNFQAPGQYTLSVITIADGVEHMVHQWINPGSVGPEQLLVALTAAGHGLGADSFRLAFVFDGITSNIVGWEFDDLELRQLSDTTHMGIFPGTLDFGSQSIGTTSSPQTLTIKNTGSSTITIASEDMELSGAHPSSFSINGMEEVITLKLFETASLDIAFSPANMGAHSAQLIVGNQMAELMGWGSDSTDYFIYSDFTITDSNRQYTNVGGFREVPAIAPSGSITATDVSQQGVFGGSVLQLGYNLDVVPDFTLYYMWAFPPVNLAQYTHLVLYLKAGEQITNLMVRLQDSRGVQGTNGASFTRIDVGTDWQSFILPIKEFELMSWATEHPDMSQIQKIDFLFEKSTTQPTQGTLWADLVGFTTLPVSTHDLYDEIQNRLFPNPARHWLIIEADAGTQISISDMNGRKMYSARVENQSVQIDTRTFSPGIYLVEFINTEMREVKKVVFQ